MYQLDPACETLMQDPTYLLRLHDKAAGLLTAKAKDGSRSMTTTFLSVDGRYKRRGSPVDVNTLLTVARPIFPIHALSDRELRVLLHMLPLTDDSALPGGPSQSLEDAGADPVDMLIALRHLVPTPAWEVWHITEKARAQVARMETMSNLEMHLRDVCAGHPVEPVSEAEANEFLVSPDGAGLSASEAALVLEYCSADDGRLDGALLHDLIFRETLPSAVDYPLLAARFAEATAEGTAKGGTGATGSLALLDAMRTTLSVPGAASEPRRADDRVDEDDIDFPNAVMDARLTGRQFFEICRRIGTQYLQEQSDLLYYYLCGEQGALLGRRVVHMYRQHFPAVSTSHFQVVQAAVSRIIAKAGDQLAFFHLYSRLQDYGAGPIPIDAFVAAIRAAGVAQAAVSDLAVEWLRLKAGTRVDLILLLCMPVPPSREAVIRKLFERLDAQQRRVVSASDVMAQFQPERIEGEQVRRNALKWKGALHSYVEEIEEEHLGYELFAFFWYMLSAAVEDDPTFTMVIWQGFSLAERRATRR